MKDGLILITGGTGKLGKKLVEKLAGRNIVYPTSEELDITDPLKIAEYFEKNDISKIIHCAALVDMAECDKNPEKAININAIGTYNLVNSLHKKQKIRFIYISTDYVYPCELGPYSESDQIKPFNSYAWSKFVGECIVKKILNHCIIRTSFFQPENIPFDTAPVDIFSSKLPINELADNIVNILDNNFVGTINIGQEKISMYDLYSKYKPSMKKTTYEEMLKSNLKRARDSSLNISLWSRINGN